MSSPAVAKEGQFSPSFIVQNILRHGRVSSERGIQMVCMSTTIANVGKNIDQVCWYRCSYQLIKTDKCGAMSVVSNFETIGTLVECAEHATSRFIEYFQSKE